MAKHKAFKASLNAILTIWLFWLPVADATEDIVLVGNIDNQKDISLTRQQVRNLFMGGSSSYKIKAVALSANHPTRVIFNTKVIGLTEARIQSYWAQMKFSGRKKPPIAFSNELELIEYLLNNPNSVGYVSSNLALPNGIEIIYKTNK